MRRFRLPGTWKVRVGYFLLSIFILFTVIGPWVAPYDPSYTGFTPDLSPSSQHLLGTTLLGQDVMSQLLVGCRETLVVSFVAGVIAVVISIIVGLTAGYVGGKTDEVLSLFIAVFLTLPGLVLLIVIISLFPQGQQANPLVIGSVVALTGWAWGAKVLRAQTLSLRNRDFVEASRIIGERRWRTIFAEIGPNLLPVLASSLVGTVLYAVSVSTVLAFLGLTPITTWNWGTMLYWAFANNAALAGEWWWLAGPCLAIALVGTSLALINFGIDEYINPRLRVGNLSNRERKRAGLSRRPKLGFTPVHRVTPVIGAPVMAGAQTGPEVLATEATASTPAPREDHP